MKTNYEPGLDVTTSERETMAAAWGRGEGLGSDLLSSIFNKQKKVL